MNKADFFELPMADQARSVFAALEILPPTSVFGSVDPKKRYFGLTKRYHPDQFKTDPVLYPLMETLQLAINAEWEQFEKGVSGSLLGEGDIAQVFIEGSYVRKVVKDAGDNDLLEREADTLKKLNAHEDYESRAQFYVPRLIGLTYDDTDRAVNTIGYSEDVTPEQLFTLEQLAKAYDFEIPIKAAGWIWRRILAALSLGHLIGVVHGAVHPDNVLLKPGIVGEKQHRGYVTDWCYSVDNTEVISVMSKKWEKHYPPEVLLKEAAVPASDIFMAAKSMLWAFPNMPMPMKRYFDRCTAESHFGRGWKFSQLINLWDDMMYTTIKDGGLGWKREFVPLNLTAVEWEWFDV